MTTGTVRRVPVTHRPLTHVNAPHPDRVQCCVGILSRKAGDGVFAGRLRYADLYRIESAFSEGV